MKMRARFRIHLDETACFVCKKCGYVYYSANPRCPECHTDNSKL